MAVVLDVSKKQLQELVDDAGLGGKFAAVGLVSDETALDKLESNKAFGSQDDLVSQAATLAVQVQFVVQQIMRELGPLDKMERYWRRRLRERFTILGLVRLKIAPDDPAEEIIQVREQQILGRRALGRCEIIMHGLQRVSSGELSGAEAKTQIRAAEEFLDQIMHLEGGASHPERVRALLDDRKQALTVDGDRVSNLKERVPLFDRLFTPKQVLKIAVGGVAAFFVARNALRFIRFVTSVDDETGGGIVHKAQTGIVKLRTEATDAATNIKAGHLPLRQQAVLFYDWICDHVILPSRSIAEQMFLRSEREASKRSSDEMAVKDARQSLRRMIENHREATNGPHEIPESKITESDLKLISRDYEKEIQAPIRGVVSGHLVELALIQVQYVKTELLDAMLLIDTLLEENKFNTQLVVLAPALLMLGALYNGTRSLYYMLINDTQSRNQVRRNLRDEALELAASLNALHRSPASNSQSQVEERHAEREGRITEAAFRLRRTMANSPMLHVEDPDEILSAVLGRTGLSPDARMAACNQLLLLICTAA
mmetsp:Transcript_13804/g.26798  ORF Transcript_13804/g.26798 Transcript_13804/m.26798 type:complete len:543 (+) Transcript_13804:158-1786(+)|eukprot:CAMPEP_0171497504 /NCGR_PEP_ID=MMETSP0958-20121227/7314_1 /TAXON_ID=87120 /ORGANISM="Aurantiochytrium limacinum, Strain ATCCMYA-1381" /LENGTH=542 /DNA_ID=CAMNT_0012031765 /DNA_START=90 /DNA_END=1718 /DNA_ORIENTATION=-